MPATLFDPIRMGAWELPHRIFMAPLTRSRAGAERIPNPLMAEYYRQRSSAALILSETVVLHFLNNNRRFLAGQPFLKRII